MKREFLLGIILLSLPLITPNAVVKSAWLPLDDCWALIICGFPSTTANPEGMQEDPWYMKNVLTQHYSFKEVRLIDSFSFEDKDKDWLRGEIKSWLGSRSDSDDLILIFFMSHGCRSADGSRGDPVDETDGIDEGLLIKEKWGLTEDWIEYYWDDETKEDLATLSYGRLFLLFQGCKVENETEGCYTGGFIRDLSAPGRIIVTPCTETQESWGDLLTPGGPSSHFGYFSRLFINASNPENTAFSQAEVNGDGAVSVWEAFNYAYQNDPARVDGRETPQLDDNGDGVANSDDGLLSYQTLLTTERPLSTDINWDGRVDILDISLVTREWQRTASNPYIDFDGNMFIDIDDVARVALDYDRVYVDTAAAEGTGTSEFFVYPDEIVRYKDETFSVDVKITNVTDLYCYQFKLYYKTAVLTCTGVSLPPDHFLKPVNPSYILIVKLEYDNAYNATHGRVRVAVTLMADEPGKNGSGTLATISFKATGLGSSPLHLYDVEIGDSSAEAMPVIPVDGHVNVLPLPTLTVLAEDQYGNSLTTGYVYIDGKYAGRTGSTFTVSAGTHTIRLSDFWDSINIGYRYGFQHWEDGSTNNPRTITVVEDTTIKAYFKKKWCPGDCNGDGNVNSLDLSILAQNWFKSIPPGDPRADLNGDGTVNLIDLNILAQNWFHSYPDP